MLKIIELFAGLGSQTQALKNIGMAHEVTAISEIDRFALQSYEALHGKPNNLGDITKITELPEADLWTYSFPCTDISLAGKQAGLYGTRSGLLWEVERLLKVADGNRTLPKYLLLENVKNLVGKKFKPDFDKWLAFLESLGYSNYWQVLNSRNYCIPQNRERVFCVSIRGEHKPYRFTEKRELRLRLKDMLDAEVEEKYYLSEQAINTLLNATFNQEKFRLQDLNGVHRTCCARDHKSPTVVSACIQAGTLTGKKWDKMHDISRRVYEAEGVSPTLHCAGGGNTEIKIIDPQGRKNKQLNPSDYCPTLRAEIHGNPPQVIEPMLIDDTYRGREPREYTEVAPTLRSGREGFKIVAGQFQPVNRDYKTDGESRAEHFECRRDDVSNAVLTGDKKNCVKIVAMRGRLDGNGGEYKQQLEVGAEEVTNTLTSVQKDNLVLESQVFKTQRTEYGKATRKEYEAGEIPGDCKTMREQVPRDDGLSNTLTTVQRDNILLEAPYIMSTEAEASKTVRVGGHGIHYGHTWDTIAESARIRKLTPWECLRLQGWKDIEINKIREAKTSNAQAYRQAGNGITVTVLMAIFGELFEATYKNLLDNWNYNLEESINE